MECVREIPDGVELQIVVQPRSSRERIEGLFQGALKIRLTQPPLEGLANKACLKFLSKKLGIPKSRLSISTGHKSRRKTVKISHISISEVRQRLSRLL